MASVTQHKRKVTARVDLDALASAHPSSPLGQRPLHSIGGPTNSTTAARTIPTGGGSNASSGSSSVVSPPYSSKVSIAGRPVSTTTRTGAGTPRAKIDPSLFADDHHATVTASGSPALRLASSAGVPSSAPSATFGSFSSPHTPRINGNIAATSGNSSGPSRVTAEPSNLGSPCENGQVPPGVTMRKVHSAKARAQSIDWTTSGTSSPSMSGHMGGSASQRSSVSSNTSDASTSTSVTSSGDRSPAKQAATMVRAALTTVILSGHNAGTSSGNSTPTPLNRTLHVGVATKMRRANTSAASSTPSAASAMLSSPGGGPAATLATPFESPSGFHADGGSVHSRAGSGANVSQNSSTSASAGTSRPASPTKGMSITEAYRMRKEAASSNLLAGEGSGPRARLRPLPHQVGPSHINLAPDDTRSPPNGGSMPSGLASPLNTVSPGAPRWSGSDASGLLSPTSEVSSTGGFKVLSPEEVADRSEAKKARKMLDLEITNKSLLAINAGLEVTKLKQAKEIRELKRRIREGRASIAPGDMGSLASGGFEEDEEEEEEEGDSDADEAIIPREDPELEAMHTRCKGLIDRMLMQARNAIHYRFEPAKEGVGGKVLHPIEVEEMREEQAEAGVTPDDSIALTSSERSIYMGSGEPQRSDSIPAILEDERASSSTPTSVDATPTLAATAAAAVADANKDAFARTEDLAFLEQPTPDVESDAETETGATISEPINPSHINDAALPIGLKAGKGSQSRIPSTATVDISID
ncbi:hypothetical protein K437DRAFT_253801 [Tilletiaria anomala UBC 951]|uniref:Uncharacterized protein n=1 Tax=Tilletiaria anomala (strain ATCC 24038 / CBS 436.72 / UBC 951) TaxID=1037660 RepID=A0A066WQI1_TILAU|nr:uncharacterized protein K437DRAFT_253801 [Tilletiaria anomala UBC 951]KDN52860.1 hypothetical protein K437DRAFT_253801 [Tilletiaria anomala UBC 951]